MERSTESEAQKVKTFFLTVAVIQAVASCFQIFDSRKDALASGILSALFAALSKIF